MELAEQIEIILVEDNPLDAELTMRGLKDEKLANNITWVKDGQQALDYLHRQKQWADPATSPRPGLILLDIHLPKVDGHGVLKAIKTNEALRSIPVVMLTTSADNGEVVATYRAGANSYVTKPLKFGLYREQMRVVKDYWTMISAPPPVEPRTPAES